MSDERPRNLTDRLRSAFLFEEASPVYDINIDGQIVPVQPKTTEYKSVSSQETRSSFHTNPD
jgi:hypothetical protein